MPARLYCGNSRTCLERPRADNGDVVTEINPYWMGSYHYDGKTDPETIACPAKEDGRKSSSSESDFEQAAGLNLEGGNEYIVPGLKVDNLQASSFQPKGGDTATETPTFDLASNTAESPPLIDAIQGAALPPIFASKQVPTSGDSFQEFIIPSFFARAAAGESGFHEEALSLVTACAGRRTGGRLDIHMPEI